MDKPYISYEVPADKLSGVCCQLAGHGWEFIGVNDGRAGWMYPEDHEDPHKQLTEVLQNHGVLPE